MPDASADFAFDQVRAVAQDAIEQALTDAEAEMRELLSVPVQKVPGGMIRSAPGEPPREEFGGLVESIHHISGIDEDGAGGCLYSSSLISLYLNDGTVRGIAPRPHWPVLLQSLQDRLPVRIALSLRNA